MRILTNNHELEQVPFPDPEQSAALFGPSRAISELCQQIRRLAPHLRAVLLTGAQSCGQEAVARLLLMFSSYPHRPFVTLHASKADQYLNGALAAGELSSVLLFLPDVDRLSTMAQEHVLRLLMSHRSNRVTVVAATAEDLRTLVGFKRFLPELAAALGEVCITIPALKERSEDLPMLLSVTIQLRCQARQQKAPKLSESLLQAAMQHQWPGNLAEMSKVVDHLLDNQPRKDVLDISAWKRALKAMRLSEAPSSPVDLLSLDTFIQQHIAAVLLACDGNKLRAAQILDVSRSTLYRLMEDGKKRSGPHLVQ